METALRLADLVGNRTMSAEIAATLREAARSRRSLLVLAIPRLAGKSTVLEAILAERPTSAPLRMLARDGDDAEKLLAASAGGYFVIPEITQSGAMPGYIWGDPVRRIFAAAGSQAALGATLHADGPDDAFAQICDGCGVPDADASKISLVVYLRSLGTWQEPTRRVVQTVHAVDGVRHGRPQTRLVHEWDEKNDRFVSAAERQ